MPVLPSKLRYSLFDSLSVKPMRFVNAIPDRKAQGLTKEVYDMIREDFFKNGSLTSRSKVPELMAAIWMAGRETMLVQDKVDRTTKDALCAVLSQINECPYCEDMLVSLVHAAGDHDTASDIYKQKENLVKGDDDDGRATREKLEWLRAAAANGKPGPVPFRADQLPEVFGTLMAMSDITRFSHVVMTGSAVDRPFGSDKLKSAALRMFGGELSVTRGKPLEKGRALSLLPAAAELPPDMAWAKPNPRIADALSRWVAAMDREAASFVSPAVCETVEASLAKWNGEAMPISRVWVKKELVGLDDGPDRNLAMLAIVLAKASYQVDEDLTKTVFQDCGEDEELFIRILAWASFSGGRRFVQILAEKSFYAL